MDVSNKNNDIILKYMSGAFKDSTLDFYGLDLPKIKGVVPTELPVLEVTDEMMDYVFELEDNTYLHLEFQTTTKSDDLARFLLYDARLYKKDKSKIKTVVIYSGDIERADDWLEIGSITYKVNNIYMRDYDGDNIYRELVEKINRDEILSKLDILNLVFLPLMKTSGSREDMAINAVELAAKIPELETKNFCTGAIIGVAYKFISKNVIEKLKEAFRMNWIVEEFRKEGKEEGIKEGIKEGELNSKIEVAKKLLERGNDIDTIAEITELPKGEIEKLKAS